MNRWLKPAIHLGGGHPSLGEWFRGNCNSGLSVAQCHASGLNPGIGWRSDSFVIEKVVQRMAKNWQRCKDAGYKGETLNKCAAPGGSALLMGIP